VYCADGLDIPSIEILKKNDKSVIDYAHTCEKITNDQLLALGVDILVPAALEEVIHEDNASTIQAKLILELANGPITPAADAILEKNTIVVIPDVLANAG
jgi:glutamate dehydrogenase (NADP+)